MTLRQRHGCLTAWLIFMIIVSSLGALGSLFFAINPNLYDPIAAQQSTSNLSSAFIVLTLISIFDIICAIALFRWKKWGFYGILGVSVVSFIISLSIGLTIMTSLTEFIGIAILYGVLNMGRENKAWGRLE